MARVRPRSAEHLSRRWPVNSAIAGICSPLAHGLAAAFLVATIPEELFKFLVLWLYALRRKEFDEPMDCVIYSVTASLGFATRENVLYVVESGFGVAVLRAMTVVPLHAFAGAIMGYYAGRARLSPDSRRRWLVPAIAVPTLFHGLYGSPLLAAQRSIEAVGKPTALILALTASVPIIVLIEWIWTSRITRRLRTDQVRLLAPGERAPEGTLPGRASSMAMTLGGAILAGAGAILTRGLAIALLSDEFQPGEIGEALAGGAFLAVAPTIVGVALFASGIRRLNERARLTSGERA